VRFDGYNDDAPTTVAASDAQPLKGAKGGAPDHAAAGGVGGGAGGDEGDGNDGDEGDGNDGGGDGDEASIGVGAGAASVGRRSLSPNKNYINRLVSSVHRSNTRIIREQKERGLAKAAALGLKGNAGNVGALLGNDSGPTAARAEGSIAGLGGASAGGGSGGGGGGHDDDDPWSASALGGARFGSDGSNADGGGDDDDWGDGDGWEDDNEAEAGEAGDGEDAKSPAPASGYHLPPDVPPPPKFAGFSGGGGGGASAQQCAGYQLPSGVPPPPKFVGGGGGDFLSPEAVAARANRFARPESTPPLAATRQAKGRAQGGEVNGDDENEGGRSGSGGGGGGGGGGGAGASVGGGTFLVGLCEDTAFEPQHDNFENNAAAFGKAWQQTTISKHSRSEAMKEWDPRQVCSRGL